MYKKNISIKDSGNLQECVIGNRIYWVSIFFASVNTDAFAHQEGFFYTKY